MDSIRSIIPKIQRSNKDDKDKRNKKCFNNRSNFGLYLLETEYIVASQGFGLPKALLCKVEELNWSRKLPSFVGGKIIFLLA